MKIILLAVIMASHLNWYVRFAEYDQINNLRTQSNESRSLASAPFRYIIFKVTGDAKRRSLAILVETSVFNEEKLISLSKLLVRRYRGTKNISAFIYSSLNQIRTPEEERKGYSTDDPSSGFYKYPFAEIDVNEASISIKYTVVTEKAFTWKVIRVNR